MAVFALGSRAHLAAQVMHDEVQSIADAQRRQIQLQQPGIGIRRIRVVHRRRPARKDDADGLVRLDFRKRDRARKHDGKDVQLANTPRNQLRILRAEIENNDCLGVHLPVWQDDGRPVKN